MRRKSIGDFLKVFKKTVKPLTPKCPSLAITGASSDSKKIGKDFIFFALAGRHVHGASFTQEAIKNGCRIILLEPPCPKSLVENLRTQSREKPLALFLVKDLSRLVGKISNWVYDDPSHDLKLLAITGTNGKTTIGYMLEAVANVAGKKVGVLSTVSYRVAGKSNPASLTTPQPDEIIRYLDLMRAKKCRVCFLEATSQALDQGRVDDLAIDGAVFTNLTRDHFDYHKNFENYFEAKAKLFFDVLANSKKQGRFAAVNLDDPWGQKLWLKLAALRGVKKISFGISQESAFVRAVNIRQTTSGVSFDLKIGDKRESLNLNLVGKHNVSNALASASSAWALGFSPKAIKEGLMGLKSVPGRLEKVDGNQNFLVLVDYAHTPDALENVIRAAKNIEGVKKVVTIFGCGGDRDRGKRPIMGQIAARFGDFVILTSDNPRSEDPQTIVKEIEEGIKAIDRKNYLILVKREEAILWAIRNAKPGDCVLVAGKGHETYQIFKDKTIHFDDREVCREALESLSPTPRTG